MVRYHVTEQELRGEIERHKPGWLSRAEARIEQLRQGTGDGKFPPLWSEIKEVYIERQHTKCAFCEKRLEGLPYGKVEQDVEHFRPKAAIKPWQCPEELKGEGVKLGSNTTSTTGYSLLAYHPLNYVMACKTCNSALKRNFFPIAGKRTTSADHPSKAKPEKPYLIYPLGDLDSDPGKIIKFYGLSPQPVAQTGFNRHRALVTIEFFKLDKGEKRKTLVRGRAEQLERIVYTLRLRKDPQYRADCEKVIKRMQSDGNEHANCVRSFARLYKQSPQEAEKLFQSVADFLDTISR